LGGRSFTAAISILIMEVATSIKRSMKPSTTATMRYGSKSPIHPSALVRARILTPEY
jgi:hypothetical protein